MALHVYEVQLRVWLESAMAFIGGVRREIRASWNDCIGLESVVKRISIGLSSITTSWTTGSMLSMLESVERA